jgi:colanic acid/amylovoran biosynthesis protein
MKILVIGQCTLHWGRMEYGNIGNYYLIEPFFRELHRVFPNADIVTTLQMTEAFCKKERISVLPMELYYGWNEYDLPIALEEYAIAKIYEETGILVKKTPYIEEVISSDLVVDISGDMWGDNADLAGKNRFLIGLLKDRIAQLLRIQTVMLAGSPGPFKNQDMLPLAKVVYNNFALVTNREKISTTLLKNNDFDISKTFDFACTSFLFEASGDEKIKDFIYTLSSEKRKSPIIGFILCGWNMIEGPFDKFPRNNTEYTRFICVIEHIVTQLNSKVCFISHSNGFELPPDFKLIKGRDFYILNQLYGLLDDNIKKNVILIDDIYLPAETKAIIRQFDMLVSGRVHGAIAALSQSIPTVIIDYGHEPKAHKLEGFAQLLDVSEYICDPASSDDMIQKIDICWANKDSIRERLEEKNKEIRNLARKNFDILKDIIGN